MDFKTQMAVKFFEALWEVSQLWHVDMSWDHNFGPSLSAYVKGPPNQWNDFTSIAAIHFCGKIGVSPGGYSATGYAAFYNIRLETTDILYKRFAYLQLPICLDTAIDRIYHGGKYDRPTTV